MSYLHQFLDVWPLGIIFLDLNFLAYKKKWKW